MASNTSDGRLLVADSTDHAAWLWITNIIGLVLIVLSAFYRVLQRKKAWTWESWDDHIAVLTFLFALIYYCVLFPALQLGLGQVEKSDNESSIFHAAQFVYASRILAAFTACASQCSVTMTLSRIVHVRRNSWICIFSTGCSVISLFAILLILGVHCPSNSAMAGIQNDKCTSLDARLIAVATIEIINELLPLALAIYFFWELQMSTERRWNAVVGYACRLSNVVLFVITTTLSIDFARSGRTSIDVVPTITVQGILVVCEFLCVVAIYLARAMNDFHTAGPEITLSSVKDHNNSSGRHGKSGGGGGGGGGMSSTSKLKSLRNDTSGVRATITHAPSSDAESDSSQKGIVKKVEYEVNSTSDHSMHQHQADPMRRVSGRGVQWDSIELENR